MTTNETGPIPLPRDEAGFTFIRAQSFNRQRVGGDIQDCVEGMIPKDSSTFLVIIQKSAAWYLSNIP